MPPSPATEPRYRPRPAKNQLQEIVEDSLEDLLRVWDERYRNTYGPLHPRVRIVLESFLEVST